MNQERLKYHITTFGCQMNLHDSERMSGSLSAAGLMPAPSVESADIVVFNTCCVREHAEERFYGRLGEIARLKRSKPGLVVAVTGCVARKDAEKVFRRAPHVDLVLGPQAEEELARLVGEIAENGHGRVCEIGAREAFVSDMPSLRESPVHAWLSIMTGCDNYCAYCIVPYVRGPERSRPFDDILDEARRLKDDGVIDVTLLGQNVNSYGRDRYGKPRFAELLSAVDDIGLERIRFTTSHPKDLCDETIEAVVASRHVCRYIHLPVQSGSSRILETMNRNYTKEAYLELVAKIRERVPDVSLSTDIIVGFPGESEADFADTIDVVRKSSFDQAFTFIYSKRSGTKAADMKDQIDEKIKRERLGRLVEAVSQGALAQNERYVGERVDVLVEGPSAKDPSKLSGRTSTNKLVHFEGHAELRHKVVGVTITAGRTWFLEGRLQ